MSLVDKPDEVKVEEKEGDKATVIELSVAAEDMGKVIGKQGRIAQAIRCVRGERGCPQPLYGRKEPSWRPCGEA